MLKWMCGKIKMDKVRNEDILSLVGVAPIENKIRENRLRWFGHIWRRPTDAPVRRVEKIDDKSQIYMKFTFIYSVFCIVYHLFWAF